MIVNGTERIHSRKIIVLPIPNRHTLTFSLSLSHTHTHTHTSCKHDKRGILIELARVHCRRPVDICLCMLSGVRRVCVGWCCHRRPASYDFNHTHTDTHIMTWPLPLPMRHNPTNYCKPITLSHLASARGHIGRGLAAEETVTQLDKESATIVEPLPSRNVT